VLTPPPNIAAAAPAAAAVSVSVPLLLLLLLLLLQLNFTLGALLQNRGEDLYRMKGILAIRGLQERYVFQVC
jgi:hypothetical protein